MIRLLILIFLLAPQISWGQSSLPPCQSGVLKSDCWGEAISINGEKYIGEFKFGRREGMGIEYSSWGSIRRTGLWKNGEFVQSMLIRRDFFASTGSGQVADLSTQDSASAPAFKPPCQSAVLKNDCVGETAYVNGEKYVGEFRSGRRDGRGIEYSSNGVVRRSGIWKDGEFIQSMALATSSFPFKSSIQSASIPTQVGIPDSTRTERDRLAAEVEAERKKRQELEEQLAQAKEREKQLAEAKERERQQAQTPQTQRQEAISRLERRVALVVGNGAYKQSPLDNAVNDATDLNAALKTLGFQTILLQNSSLQMMKQKTREFADLAINADVALIFYSGHGIEYRGNNYLIPTSTGSLREFEVEDETFNVSRWMDMLESQKGANKQRVNIVILDACRDNAFSRGWRNTNRGLARMDAPSGTILALSTSPGKVASDGNRGDRNSPYTKSLLRAMQQQNAPIEQVFKDVRRMVVEQTKGEQVPWENSSLIGNFVFKR